MIWRLLWLLPVALIGAFLLRLKQVGEFKTLTAHSPGECHAVQGVPGPEDLVVAGADTVLISSLDRMAPASTQGALYRYKTGSAAGPEKLALSGFNGDFRPHGLSLWTGPDGSMVLFVVNHRRSGDTVEIFAVADEGLIHQVTIEDPLINNANSIAAVAARSFYLTSDHDAHSELGGRLQDYLGWASGSVVFYDGTAVRRVADRIAFANGIALDVQQSLVYVATTLGRKLLVYRRDSRTNDLTILRTIDLPSAPDNLRFDGAGGLLVGAHPRLFSLGLVRDGLRRHSPSQVLRVRRAANGVDRIEEVYVDLGEQVSSSSVAVAVTEDLLIGSVYDDHLLMCHGFGAGSSEILTRRMANH